MGWWSSVESLSLGSLGPGLLPFLAPSLKAAVSQPKEVLPDVIVCILVQLVDPYYTAGHYVFLQPMLVDCYSPGDLTSLLSCQ